jgi:hypothetical protein
MAALLGGLLVAALVRRSPNDDPVSVAALFVPVGLLAVSMSRVTVYATPEALVVRNLCWKRRITWVRIRSFGVKRYRLSIRHYAASVVVHTDTGANVRVWATMTRSRRRVAEIAAALEALAEEHGIPAEIDPDRLRCRWYWEAQPSRDDH